MIDFNEPYATVSSLANVTAALRWRIFPLANVTAALRWRIFPPVVGFAQFPSANEPCRKHAFAITLGYLTT